MILFFSGTYELQVPENHKVNEKIGTLELEDRDQIQNKEPIFSLPSDINRLFGVELSATKDANLMLRKVGGRRSVSYWQHSVNFIRWNWGKPEMFKSTMFQLEVGIILGNARLHYCC